MRMFRRFFWYSAGCVAIAAGAFLMDSPRAKAPAVLWFHPGSGAPGTQVHIVGVGLGDAALVTFGGTRAEFTCSGPLVIWAKVPPGAVTGPITVTTPQGTVASAAAFPVSM